MKKYKIFRWIIVNGLIISFLLSCVKDQDFSTPKIDCTDPEIVETNTIQQIKEMYQYGGVKVIEDDIIIKGYVVSNDRSGNIYKTLSIQDFPESPTSAIKIAIDQTDLYTKFEVGRKIYVKLKGLSVGFSYGSIQIGKEKGTTLDRIPAFELNNFIVRSCEVAEIKPKQVAIADINESMLEMLLEIKNVQFGSNELGNAFGNIGNTTSVDRRLQCFGSDCMLIDEIVIRNSGYSDFKNELLPEGKGSVVAILSNYYDDFQLYLRSKDDLNFENERCDNANMLTPTITLGEIQDLYVDSMMEFGVDEGYIIEGYVISSDEQGNFENKLVIQDAIEDPTSGIQILLESETIFEHYNVGDKVYVKLDKLYMVSLDGILTIGYPEGNSVVPIDETDIGNFIYNSGENYKLIPAEISIDAIENGNFNNRLIALSNVQLIESEQGKAFTTFSGTNDDFRVIESCNQTAKLSVFTNGKATFANELFPQGNGSIEGVLSNKLEIRNLRDIQFNNAYEICPVFTPKVMITEIADPKNSTSARFVELHNAGDFDINLTGWKLQKYINGALNYSSTPISLNGFTIEAGKFMIIANTGYRAVFNDIPEIESNYISGNGDDVYQLVDNSGEVIDIYGKIGEDGNGTNWEYLDGRAVRRSFVNEPNGSFEVSEWIRITTATNALVSNSNSPQNAPENFNPRER